TSWVFAPFGKNFVRTMLGLLQEKDSIRVVNDQIGSPTYAPDLARVILDILRSGKWVSGIYHYSNVGRISWFDFASEIRAQIGSTCKVEAIPTSDYPTPAKRPRFSLLNTDKISEVFGLKSRDWKEALRECLAKLG
ncbi:MAG: SDR family oxidoreductase, partial [Bacteroidota bacterium]